MRAAPTTRERAVALYYAVRDGLRYDPYRIDLSVHGMKASTALAKGYGWCVPKAALLAAVCRAAGIPARVGYADVRNHLSTERHAPEHGQRPVRLARLHRHLARRRAGSRPRRPSTSSCATASACCRWSSTAAPIRSTTPSTAPATATWNTWRCTAPSTTCRCRSILDAFAVHYPNMPLENDAQDGDFEADAAAERAAR